MFGPSDILYCPFSFSTVASGCDQYTEVILKMF